MRITFVQGKKVSSVEKCECDMTGELVSHYLGWCCADDVLSGSSDTELCWQLYLKVPWNASRTLGTNSSCKEKVRSAQKKSNCRMTHVCGFARQAVRRECCGLPTALQLKKCFLKKTEV